MAYKTFVNGFPLNASEINNNLMNQVISTFADASARSTAISAPVEGQVTYLTSTDNYWKWDGSAWVELEAMSPDFTVASSPNYIINGAFDVWQRGTSGFSSAGYTADRWYADSPSYISRSTDVPAGLEAYSYKFTSVPGAAAIRQQVELPATGAQGPFADGTTWTFSCYAKSTISKTLKLYVAFQSSIGVGQRVVVSSLSIGTTSSTWQRFTYTFTVPSGASVATSNALQVTPFLDNNESNDFYITGVQLEAGSVATPFKRHAPSLQGELAACQRYYLRYDSAKAGSAFMPFGIGRARNATISYYDLFLPVEMRTNPTFSSSGTFSIAYLATSIDASSLTVDHVAPQIVQYYATATSGVLTGGDGVNLRASNNNTCYIELSAEL